MRPFSAGVGATFGQGPGIAFMSATTQHIQRRSRVRRRIVWTILLASGLLVIGIAIALWIITRSWFIIAQVQPELERKLGGMVTLGEAHYDGNGRFVFHDLELRAASLPDEPGRIARIRRATISVDERKLYSGQIELLDVRLNGLVLRLSESMREPGRFNFLALQPDWSDDEPGEPMQPPRVHIEDAVLEIGRHGPDGYTVQAQRRLRGEMTPGNEAGWYAYELTELDSDGSVLADTGIRMNGDWNVETHHHHAHIHGVNLDERTRLMFPSVVRAHWDRMDLQGSIDYAEIEWNSERQYTINLSVDDIAMTLPIDLKGLWARYEGGEKRVIDTPPRLHVQDGDIEVTQDTLHLKQMKGQVIGAEQRRDLIPVPYTMTLRMRDLPPIDWQQREQWMSNVLEVAPFTMRFALGEFGVHEEVTETGRSVELPTLIAEILTRFHMKNWRVTTNGTVTRPPPTQAAQGATTAQPIEVTGQAYISADRAVYDKFPYPLDDVAGGLRFNNNGLFIDRFRGRGSNGTVVRLAGKVSLPGQDGDANISLTAENAPIDSRFRSALKGGNAKLYDMLLDETSYCELVRAGLLSSPNDPKHVVDCPGNMTPSNAAQSEEKSARQDEVRGDALPFQFGGTVDVDLHIKRDVGPDQPTYLAGDIHINEIGVVARPFAYPVTITDGTLRVQRDRVTLLVRDKDAERDGLAIETPGGGRGTLSGELLIERSGDDQDMTPDLHVRVHDDPVNELLYAAIPDTSIERLADPAPAAHADPDHHDDNLSPTARIVKSLHLDGLLQWDARFTGSKTRPLDYQIDVDLADATASPDVQLAEALGAAGLVWPPGMTVENVHGSLRVRPGEAHLKHLTGSVMESEISASTRMKWNTQSPETRVDVQFENLPFGPYLIDLLPQKRQQAVRSFWNRYDPSGRFDAQLAYRIKNGERHPPRLTVFNPNLTFMIDHRVSGVNYVDGALHVTSQMVAFDNLRLSIPGTDTDPSDGILVLDGRYGTNEELDGLSVNIDWFNGRFSSPLIPELLRLLGSEAHARTYRMRQPRGEFDATFRYDSDPEDDQKAYELTLRPRVFSVHLDEKTVPVEIDKPSRLIFSPSVIKLDQLTGTLPGGTFTMDGVVRFGESLFIDSLVNYDGTLTSESFLAMVPAPVRDVIHDLSLEERKPSRLRDARFTVHRLESPDNAPPVWKTNFDGTIVLRHAAFNAGIPIDSFQGDLDLSVEHRSGEAPAGHLTARARRVRAVGQNLENVFAKVTLDDEATLVHMDTFRADMHGGAVTIEAQAGLEDGGTFDAQVNLAGVSLADFMSDFGAAAVEAGQESDDGATVGSSDAGASDGRVYASLQLRGQRGQPTSRVGRGSARVIHGRMSPSPMMLRLLQISELMLPIAGSLETASLDFFVHGERVVFEDIRFECATLDLDGRGEMNYRTNEINLRFGRRGTLLVLGDIVGEISDALFLVEVTGTLDDPITRIVPLPAISRSQQSETSSTTRPQRAVAVPDRRAGEQ